MFPVRTDDGQPGMGKGRRASKIHRFGKDCWQPLRRASHNADERQQRRATTTAEFTADRPKEHTKFLCPFLLLAGGGGVWRELLALLAETFHAQVGRVDHEFGGAGKVVYQTFKDGSGEVFDGSAAAADQMCVLGPSRQVVAGSGSD